MGIDLSRISDPAYRATLPAWVQSQLREVPVYTNNGDNGTQQTGTKWVVGPQGEFGGTGTEDYGGFLRDQAGTPVMPLGDWDGKGYLNNWWGLKDPSKVRDDPVLGRVSDISNMNLRHKDTGGINWGMVAAFLGAGALGTAAGLGAEAGAGAGEGLGAGTMTGAAGDESLGLAGTGSYSGGGGLGAGSAGYDASGGGLLNSGLGGGEGGSGGLLNGSVPYMDPIPDVGAAPTINPMVNGPGNMPWWQEALNAAKGNPLGTARTVMGLYSLGNSLFGNQHVSAGHPQYAGGGGGVAQGVPTLSIGGGGQSGFQQNPFLVRQMFNVPFMSGATGLLS